MEMMNTGFMVWLLLSIFPASQEGTYSNIERKSWEQILREDRFKWQPPRSNCIPIQPPHSPLWVQVNSSMAVSWRQVRDDVPPDDYITLGPVWDSAEDLVVQFAFDDPAYIPDARLTGMRLAENRYPVLTEDYFGNDTHYEIRYAVQELSEMQSLLGIKVRVKNEGSIPRNVTVRSKIAYYPDNKTFDETYLPFLWPTSKWMPFGEISMDGNGIFRNDTLIGHAGSEDMDLEWEPHRTFTDKDYDDLLYPQVWFGSGFVRKPFRLYDVSDVIRASASLEPGDTSSFEMVLLVDGQPERTAGSPPAVLQSATADGIASAAIERFKSSFEKGTASLEFPVNHLDDRFSALQTQLLQFMVGFPGKDTYKTFQSGYDHYAVWVFEEVQAVRPLLRLGYFDEVRKVVDYVFSLQDAGYPPEGRFTSLSGAIGTTAPRWASTTGAALTLASEYYLYSRDTLFLDDYLPKILKAMRWIVGEISATRKLNPDGSRPLTHGIFPFSVSGDGERGYFITTDIISFRGLESAVEVLERIGCAEAASMRREVERYRADIITAVHHLARADGNIIRYFPDPAAWIVTKFASTDNLATLVTTGLMDPASEVFSRYVSYFENHVASGYMTGMMDRDIAYMIQGERYWQPVYLQLGAWKKAFMLMEMALRYGMSQDCWLTVERCSKRDPSFTPLQPDASGSGGILNLITSAIYYETQEMATVLGAVPFQHLLDNHRTALHGLRTLTGEVDIDVVASDKEKRCLLSIRSSVPLPKTIRIPAHFGARLKGGGARRSGEDTFTVKAGTRELTFALTRNDE